MTLTINDNNNESFQIWGDSCGSDGCGGNGVMKHKFDSSGNANHVGTITANKLCIGNTCFTENDMKKLIKHGDQITIKSNAHGGRRLQNNNGDSGRNAKFQNHNRLGWEKMNIEKCGFPGIGDNRQCG